MLMFSGSQIRLLRYSRQMKQEHLAQKMGISKQRYSQLENQQQMPLNRQKEILAILGYTAATARKYLNSIPSPKG